MTIKISQYPQLRLISWNRQADAVIKEDDAFALYERNWHHIDFQELTDEERKLIERLTKTFGNGVLNI